MESLKTFTVSFFGRGQIDNVRLIEDKLDDLIYQLLSEKEYVEFLVGREGDFDPLVSSTVKRVKQNYRNDNSSLVWVLPYSTAELRLNLKNFREYYDEINIYDTAENVHPKAAFQYRNRSMVDRSDLVVFFVNHESGGAWQTMQYAVQKDKTILNLAPLANE